MGQLQKTYQRIGLIYLLSVSAKVLKQAVWGINFICEDYDDGVGWYDSHPLDYSNSIRELLQTIL